MADLLASSSRISIAVAASRVLGLAREICFAALFGASAMADAFQVAFRIPSLLRDLLAEGALSSAFVPTYAAHRAREGDRAAMDLADCVLSALLLFTALLCSLGWWWAPEIVYVISDGFAGNVEKTRVAVELTRIMLPILALVSVSAVWMGVLNAHGRHMPPACGPLVFNVVSIAAGVALLVLDLSGGRTLEYWAWATLLSVAGQGAVQLIAVIRMGYLPRLRMLQMWRHPGLRNVLLLMAPAVIGVAAIQLNVTFNTRFASALGDGPVAQLSYAFRVFYLPIGVFSVALATVTTTRVADEAAHGRSDRVGLAAREGMAGVWVLLAGSAVGIATLAEPIVAVLFERGAFDSRDTLATAMVLRAYAVALVPYGLVKVLAPVFYGLERPRIALEGSLLAVAINLTFNALTYRELGAPGIALGTGLGAIANCVYLGLRFRSLCGPSTAKAGRHHLVLAGAVLSLAAVCMLGAWALYELESRLGALGSGWMRPVALLVIVACASAVYVALLSSAGHPVGARLGQMSMAGFRRLRRKK